MHTYVNGLKHADADETWVTEAGKILTCKTSSSVEIVDICWSLAARVEEDAGGLPRRGDASGGRPLRAGDDDVMDDDGDDDDDEGGCLLMISLKVPELWVAEEE